MRREARGNGGSPDREVIESRLDSMLGELLRERDVWILRPVLLEALRGYEKESSLRTVINRAVSDMPLRRHILNYGTDDNRSTYCWTTINQFRSLGGERLRSRLSTVDSSVDRLEALSVAADRTTRRLARSLTEATSAVGIPSPLTTRLVRLTAQAVQSAHRLIDRAEPERIIVATQHSIHSRAISWIARERDIPTVYVPHAPFTMTRQYADLPFDYAALEGKQSIEYYAGLGADPTRLHVVGNLSLGDLPDDLVFHRGQDRVIVAPSPWNDEKVRWFMQVVQDGLDGRYCVYPHPRSDHRVLRRAMREGGNLVIGQRTADALMQGAVAVIQHGSGVSLEAMLLGIPVIEVLLDRSIPWSLVTQEPHAYVVKDAADLRRCLQIIADGEPDSRIAGRRIWAREWCAATGSESERRLRQLLRSGLRAEGPLLDGWSQVAAAPHRTNARPDRPRHRHWGAPELNGRSG